jgi:hypothetical protein
MLSLGLALGLAISVQAQQPVQGSAAPDPGERMICKKEQETGSLIRSKKRCMTATEWERLASAGRFNAEDITDRNRGATCGVGPC